jgi:hypothetical protein
MSSSVLCSCSSRYWIEQVKFWNSVSRSRRLPPVAAFISPAKY